MAVLNLSLGVSCRVHLHGLRCAVQSEPGDLRTKAAGKLDNAQRNLVLETAQIYYIPDFKVLVTINSETFTIVNFFS